MRIACNWGFTSVYALARRLLLPIASSVDKIAFGHEFDESGWLLDAYIDLCTGEDVPTIGDAERLGLADIVHIWTVRETLWRKDIPNDDSDVSEIVHRICCPHIPMVPDQTTSQLACDAPKLAELPIGNVIVGSTPATTAAPAVDEVTNKHAEEVLGLQSRIDELAALVTTLYEDRARLEAKILDKHDESGDAREPAGYVASQLETDIEHLTHELEACRAEAEHQASIINAAKADISSTVKQVVQAILADVKQTASGRYSAAQLDAQNWKKAVVGEGAAKNMKKKALKRRKNEANDKVAEAMRLVAAVKEVNSLVSQKLS